MVRAASPASPSANRTTVAPRRGPRWLVRKRNTSGVLTSAGGLPTTEKNTFKSKATASQVLRRARAPTNARYSSSSGSPNARLWSSDPTMERTRHGVNVNGWSLPVGLGGWHDKAGKLSPGRAIGDQAGKWRPAHAGLGQAFGLPTFPHPDDDG